VKSTTGRAKATRSLRADLKQPEKNEPISLGFPHLQVEPDVSFDLERRRNRMAKKKALKKAKKIQPTKTLCCSGTH
jgi:hypothetical protein